MEPIQNRRSSILKPQKPRNPLSDLDLIEPDEDCSPVTSNVTGRSSMRRVSFASSNFIKQFVTDPEKNTIWDTTYEETANKSDSAHGSGINETASTSSSSGRKCKVSINLKEQHEEIVSTSSLSGVAYDCEKQVIQKQIVQTSGVGIVNKSVAVTSVLVTQQKIVVNSEEQLSLAVSNERKCKDLQDKENFPISYLLANDKDNIVLARRQNNCALENKTLVGEDNMDITLLPSVSFKNDLETSAVVANSSADARNKTVMDVVSMELTPPLLIVTTDNCDVKNKTVVDDAVMEFTQPIPVHSKNYGGKNKTLMDADMEFTQECPTFTKKTCDTTTTSSKKNVTLADDKTMEFTQQVPVVNMQNIAVKTSASPDRHCYNRVRNQTVMDTDMEITLESPGVIKKSSEAKNMVTMKAESIMSAQIHQLPDEKSSGNTKTTVMEHSQLSGIPKSSDEATSSIKLKSDTHQFPILGNQPYGVENIMVINSGMELTLETSGCHTGNISTMKDKSAIARQDVEGIQQIPVVNMKLNLQCPISKNNNEDGTSSIKIKCGTQQFPVFGNQKYGVENKTVADSDMEITLDSPGSQKTCNTMKDDPARSRHVMEFKQQIHIIDENRHGITKGTVMGGNIIHSQQSQIAKSSGEATVTSNVIIKSGIPAAGGQSYDVTNKTGMDTDMKLTLETPGCHTGNISTMKDKSAIAKQDVEEIQHIPVVNMKLNQQCPISKNNNEDFGTSRIKINCGKQQISIAGNQSYVVENNLVMQTDMKLTLGTAGIQESCEARNISTLKNRFTSDKEAMEFIQQIPTAHEDNYGIIKDAVMDSNVEPAWRTQIPKKNCGEAAATSSIKIKCGTQQFPVFGNQKYGVENKTVADSDMEITLDSPGSQKTCNTMKDDPARSRHVMEFKQQILIIDENRHGITKGTVMGGNMIPSQQSQIAKSSGEASDTSNVIIKSGIPTAGGQSYDVTNKTGMDTDMELTLESPDFIQKRYDATNTSTMENKSTIAAQTMEFTHQIPVVKNHGVKNKTHMEADMEFTQQYPLFDKTFGTSAMQNQTVLGGATMEFTQPIPVVNRNNYSVKNKSVTGALQGVQSSVVTTDTLGVKNELAVDGIGMKFTQQCQIVKPKDDGDTSTSSNLKNMVGTCTESTQQIPAVERQTYNIDNLLDDKEPTQPHPNYDSTTNSGMKKDATRVEHHVEVSLKIPLDGTTTHSIPSMDLPKIGAGQQPLEDFLGIKNLSLTNPMADVDDQNPVVISSDVQVYTEPNKLPLNEPDANCSVFKTPSSSFHMCSTPYSTSIDDTRHLVNYSCSSNQPKSDFSRLIQGNLNYTPLSNRFMHLSGFSSNAFPISLETSRNNQTNIDCDADDKECKMQLESCNKLKRPSLENIEDAVVCKKPMLGDTQPSETGLFDADKMETSMLDISPPFQITNISQYDNSFPEQEIKEATHSFVSVSRRSLTNASNHPSDQCSKNWAAHLKTTQSMENKLRIFRERMVQSGMKIAKISEQLEEQFTEEMAEMKRPFKPPVREKFSNDSSSECSFMGSMDRPEDMAWEETEVPFCSDDEPVDVPAKILSLEEKIEERGKRCKRYWSVQSMEDGKFLFETLFKTILLTVQVTKDTAIVETIEVHNNIPDAAEPQARFVHKIFNRRLAERAIRAAVGEHYDILTLLDYIYMNMHEMMGILQDLDSFTMRYGLQMHENYRVSFSLISLPLRTTWHISVDMADPEHVSEDSVQAFATVGSVKERDIKCFVANCPRGTTFLRHFIANVVGYVELMKERKKTLVKWKAIS